MQIQWVDIAIVTLIGLSILTGMFRGFVKELIALCIWVLAMWLGYHYTERLDPLLISYIHDKSLRTGVAFIIILFASLVVGGIINVLVSSLLKRSGLSGIDKTLGMGFGLLRGVFIIAILMVAIKMTSIPYQQYEQNSLLYARFDPLVVWLYDQLPVFIKQVKRFEVSENEKEIMPTFALK